MPTSWLWVVWGARKEKVLAEYPDVANVPGPGHDALCTCIKRLVGEPIVLHQ